MNYKNILFQFLAGLSLLLGIKQFFIFIELDLLELITSMGKESFAYYAEKSDKFGISNKINRLVQTKIILGFVAIMINYIFLFIIAFKKKLNWNISLVITVLLSVIHFFDIIKISPISFVKLNLITAYMIPAFLLMALAGLFYFLSFKTSSK